MITTVIKRDGTEVPYNSQRISDAIRKANNAVDILSRATDEEIEGIVFAIETKFNEKPVLVEEIQDIVEDELMRLCKYNLAKVYIRYREKRNFIRKSNTTDDSILSLLRDDNEEVARENSNKKATTNSTKRDLIAGEVSKDLSRRILLPKDVVDAHDRGTIHFHDMDYFMMDEFNCCLPNFRDMLENGFAINGVKIDTPKSFRVACNQVTQIMAAVASNQYGGQTFYSDVLGKYLRYTKEKITKRVRKEIYETFRSNNDEDIDDGYIEQISKDMIDRLVKDELAIELEAGIQTIQYQVNTMYTSNGQSPFVTIFMYLRDDDPYVEEHAMIIEEILRQRMQGLKNKAGVYVTPTFPKLIYVLGENNINPDSKYYYLTRLAAECTAKRMYPDYISEKVMKENYDGSVFGCMGCVAGFEVVTYKLHGLLFVEGFEDMWRRLAEQFEIKLQPCGGENFYMDLTNVEVWDTLREDFVKTTRIIKNEPTNTVTVYFTNGRMIECTKDHVFTTTDGRDVQVKDLTEKDEVWIGNYQYSDEFVD